jgi:GNAT superfamily N-acetyltransferase
MITIRPAQPGDASLILSLIRGLAKYEREPDAVHLTEADLLRDGFGSEPYFECLIAEENNQPAGFALYFPIYSTWQGRSLHLEDLFVLPEFRGRGLGKALLKRVATIAAERNCVRLQWGVLEWNQPAIDFYDSIGAKTLGDWRRMRLSSEAIQALTREKNEAATI